MDLNSLNPTPPYNMWSTAATNIQDAVDASTNGDFVLVTNGVYVTGGRNWYGSGTNRVTLTNAITLQSVNGPTVTLIVGNQVIGSGAVLTNAARCVGMISGAVLSGFTLTNGEAGTGNYPAGGGVMCANSIVPGGTVTNCILINNLATNDAGGGAYRVRLINCQIIDNSARYGGGAAACNLINCLVVGNNALDGGGVYGSSTLGASALTNCTIVGNYAAREGGGVDNGGLSVINNCIVYYNTSPNGTNYNGVKLAYCCTTPILVGDTTSFTNAPLFQHLAIGNFRLQSNSPCINAGNNSYVTTTTDLGGQPRINASTVDVGAYEYSSTGSLLPLAWMQQYGLPTDGSVDFEDSDGDGLNNWQEWKAGTNPTNALSVLKMMPPGPGLARNTVVVMWQSAAGVTYYLQRSTGLTAPFTVIQSNLLGHAGTTSYTDTTATNASAYFYRVGVQ